MKKMIKWKIKWFKNDKNNYFKIICCSKTHFKVKVQPLIYRSQLITPLRHSITIQRVQLIWTVRASFPECQQSTAVVVPWRGLDALTLHLPHAAAFLLSHLRLLLISDRWLRCFSCSIYTGGLAREDHHGNDERNSKVSPTAQTKSRYQNVMDDIMFIMIYHELR